MNHSPKISVIVPIYKAEKYLTRCVDSILSQTFQDFEVLLIDDGSPDKSGEICDEYAAKDSRIKVYHKENGGVSSARQLGLDNAVGEYVIHADPDDWVEPQMLECLYAKAIEDNADMVICDFYYTYELKDVYCSQQPLSLEHNSVLSALYQNLHGSCWNKLTRLQCIRKYNIRFDLSLSFCEDLNFNSALLLHNINISYLPNAFYHYDQFTNNTSIVRTKYTDATYISDIRLFNTMLELMYGNESYEVCRNQMGYLVVIRAFEGNIYSSREFKSKCKQFLDCVLKRKNIRIQYRLIYILSCIGLYRLMYTIWFNWVNIKQKYHGA